MNRDLGICSHCVRFIEWFLADERFFRIILFLFLLVGASPSSPFTNPFSGLALQSFYLVFCCCCSCFAINYTKSFVTSWNRALLEEFVLNCFDVVVTVEPLMRDHHLSFKTSLNETFLLIVEPLMGDHHLSFRTSLNETFLLVVEPLMGDHHLSFKTCLNAVSYTHLTLPTMPDV